MDVSLALKDAENALRDFIALKLEQAFGKNWEDRCGASEEKLTKWRERKQIEAKRQTAGVTEERLLYYADFFDLRTILKKHWADLFFQALGDWKTMEVWLGELEKLRDPDAHRRELLPHQQHLAIGISGEIRTRITKYRSEQETGESYFPRIESARDSLGTIYSAGENTYVRTGRNLRPGTSLDFVITASDPLGAKLCYSIEFVPGVKWQDNNFGSLAFGEKHVRLGQNVFLTIKSPRAYHAKEGYDDLVIFEYNILPPKS